MNSPQQQALPVFYTHAQGAIFGALIGDAAGATLEFIGHKPSDAEVDNALQMVGGGVWEVAPGQITDDGELTIALAHALTAGKPYDPVEVASQYRLWYLSPPFDIGNATHAAMYQGIPGDPAIVHVFQSNAAQHNMASKANGSLMRATPLGVWGVSASLKETIDAARQDAQLTHPNPSCQWAGVAYAVAIRHLLLHPGDVDGAFKAVELALIGEGASEVRGWIKDAERGTLPPCYPQAGFVRIGFTYAFYHLRQGSDFVSALRHTLSGGGDTDTNACIVGGLLGALHGMTDIPVAMRQALLCCDTSQGRPRPEWLCTPKLMQMIDPLVHATSSPSSTVLTAAPADHPNWNFARKLTSAGETGIHWSDWMDSSPSQPIATIDMNDKVEGMMLGLAIGDSLGNTSEFLPPQGRLSHYGWIDDYLPNQHAQGKRIGLPSDDTQMAFWTLEQSLEDGHLIPERLANIFSQRHIYGLGDSVREFLRNYKSGTPWHQAGALSAGNGAIMRIAPVLIPHLRHPSKELWGDIVLAAHLTHRDGLSTASCLGLSVLLWEAMGMQKSPPGEWWLNRFEEVITPMEASKAYRSRLGAPVAFEGKLSEFIQQEIRPALVRGDSILSAGSRWYSGAYCLETVPVVLLILAKYGNDPDRAMLEAVNHTKDNDTVAAIVGASVGALHGKSGFRPSWLKNLSGRTGSADDGQIFELLEKTVKVFGVS